tara:strand:+ start:81 stop:311 length:231 start_codon:yes stop_codon:yes gene_type:complete
MTANQKYKKSKSELPFKEWLKEEQKLGNLKNHNLIKDSLEKDRTEILTIDKKPNNTLLHILGFASASLLIYGLTKN